MNIRRINYLARKLVEQTNYNPDLSKVETTYTKLGWEPEYTFESMVQEMVDHWMTIID